MLSPDEIARYSRHLTLPEWSEEKQLSLKKAKVLVVGAGALGCAVLPYLVAAGVGELCILDADVVEVSNLHRQVLYRQEDIGKGKAETACERLSTLNPHVKLSFKKEWLTSQNAFELSDGYDFIVDGTDNFPTRYLVNDLCVLKNKVNIHGSIQGFQGQVAVFNALMENGERSPNYRDLYPNPPAPGEVKSCAENGVIGALPGIIGSMMALETIKVISQTEGVLTGQVASLNFVPFHQRTLRYRKDPQNPLRREENRQETLIDYDAFCGVTKTSTMKEITVQELKEWMNKGEDFQLVDVREQHEFDEANMDGHLIPLGEVPTRFSEIEKDKKVVIHCRSGVRSANAIQYLQTQGFDNLYNLQGGILAWLAAN
jgi:adenylyltransferase/sulfurtransferase